MAISREAYVELQNALGEENVTDDPGILQGYCYMNSIASNMTGYWVSKPFCVALPESVEDVEAVLEICRRYGLQFKAFSTGWSFLSMPAGRETVLMDLRRMNHIRELDERNGYMLVEPYVTSGLMQIEAMKKGLNCHHIGCGPNCSALASATSFDGTGGTGCSTSRNERNVLGVELVTAGGDVLRLGSAETPNAGWFSGDGPGPGLRGMMRGSMGSFGSQGVYTKIALKCYPWHTEEFDCGGSPPFFETKEASNFTIRFGVWYDVDNEIEGIRRITEAELVDDCERFGPGALESAYAVTNEEYKSIVESEIYRNSFPYGTWMLSVIGSSKRAFDYKYETLEKIIEDTGGILVDPADLGSFAYEVATQIAVRQTTVFKAAYMPTSSFSTTAPGSFCTLDMLRRQGPPIFQKTKAEALEKGFVANDGLDNGYMQLDENGHFGHNEGAYHNDHYDPDSEGIGMTLKAFQEAAQKNVQAFFSFPTPASKIFEYMKYVRKIQALLDPVRIADSLAFFGAFDMLRPLDEAGADLLEEPERVGEIT